MIYKTRISLKNYWGKIVGYYYDHPDIQDRGHSIWDWLRHEYGARRIHGHPNHSDLLEFEKDEDAVIFALRWSS